ncbi:12127_t:CDS:2 [Funneliformis caledonium]|uniref:12127_t:CDS:1 n=1 Tax=Funneliformis caledonium TaxID=1117310 RepID=A0A9N9FKQ7_9GLOM|nr:12127_t:CDS:2 [Funneliformis caledonium]
MSFPLRELGRTGVKIPTIDLSRILSALAELVKERKIKYIDLSECSVETLRRAIKFIQLPQFNLGLSILKKNGIMETCRELGITIVAYSPLGRGFLTGRYKSFDDLEPGDIRRTHPRFQPENFAKNLELVHKFMNLLKRKCYFNHDVVIPGTKKVKYLEENLGANY